MCWVVHHAAPHSVLQNFNYDRMDAEQLAEKLEEAKGHLEVCADIYKLQIARNIFFLHEHPDLVGSWKEEVTDELLQDRRGRRVQGDMCRHGMRGQGELAEAAVKKRTGFMTNSKQIGKASSLFCENRPGELKAWKRIDFGVQHMQSIKKGGPEWKQIVRRVTMDAQTREVLQYLKDFQSATRSDIWQRFGERRDVITLFYYRERGSKWRRHVQLVGGKERKQRFIQKVCSTTF